MRTHLFIIQISILIFCLAQVSFTQVTSDQLVEVISESKAEEVEQMLESGTDANELSSVGATPLIHATWGKDITIVKLLVENGADINLNTERFGCALNVAASVGAGEIADYLIENEVNLNCQDKEGKTPLMSAIYDSQPDMAKMLIDKGADVNIKGDSDWTALMFAAMRGDVESVKNLIDANVNVNSKTKDGETPLQRATALEYKEIIAILKNAGAE
jgi:ankyrin repeat protein